MAERARSAPGGAADKVGEIGDKLGSQAADAIDRIESKVKDVAGLGEIAGELKNTAGDVLKNTAGDVKTAAVEQGRQIYEAAKEQATGFVDQRKNDAAQSVADLASSLRESGKGFEERPNIQAFVGTAADGLEQLATGLRERSFADIYADVEDYARRSPATVGAVAVISGFLLARFIKSSAEGMSQSHATRVGPRGGNAGRRPSPSRPMDA
ncbi:hypothetical protein [uncultured Enterovirga sp.]|uniref:hypothetical protein n=1 Tax=uncultured Enterovirga sp. TaxID=2026352 RepID=UPI0035CA18DE